MSCPLDSIIAVRVSHSISILEQNIAQLRYVWWPAKHLCSGMVASRAQQQCNMVRNLIFNDCELCSAGCKTVSVHVRRSRGGNSQQLGHLKPVSRNRRRQSDATLLNGQRKELCSCGPGRNVMRQPGIADPHDPPEKFMRASHVPNGILSAGNDAVTSTFFWGPKMETIFKRRFFIFPDGASELSLRLDSRDPLTGSPAQLPAPVSCTLRSSRLTKLVSTICESR